MPLANVALTNTFDEWRLRTNQIMTASGATEEEIDDFFRSAATR